MSRVQLTSNPNGRALAANDYESLISSGCHDLETLDAGTKLERCATVARALVCGDVGDLFEMVCPYAEGACAGGATQVVCAFSQLICRVKCSTQRLTMAGVADD